MSHLGERVTDYVVGEMTDSEAAEVSEHLRQCSDCSGQVEAFKRTLTMLQAVPDREPPRPLVFEVEQRKQSRAWLWGWASPAAAAVAASILTAMLMSPAPAEKSLPVQQASIAPASPAVDSQKIAAEVQAVSQSWLAAELSKRDEAHQRDLRGLRSEIAYWESQQRLASRETLNTAVSIQQLARKLPSGE